MAYLLLIFIYSHSKFVVFCKIADFAGTSGLILFIRKKSKLSSRVLWNHFITLDVISRRASQWFFLSLSKIRIQCRFISIVFLTHTTHFLPLIYLEFKKYMYQTTIIVDNILTMLYKPNYSPTYSIEEKANRSLLFRIFFTGNLMINHIRP